MKITEHFYKNKNKTLFSIEVIPPKKGDNIQDLYDNIDILMEFNPNFIDVTTSREEYIYVNKNGYLDKKLTRMRPGTIGICAAIMHKYQVEAIPHILCGGFTKQEIEYLLIDCHYLGIDNLVALRGDPRKDQKLYIPTKGGHHYANDLLKQIKNMNEGKFLDSFIQTDYKINFCVGIAGYPEKHIEAPSLHSDLKRLKEKVDTGADYIVTQMFFDNKKYFYFVEKAKEIGIYIPIIPGIKPITTKNHLNILPQIFHIDLPEELIHEIEKCKNNSQVKEIGIEWCIKQSLELKKAGVPVLHYYSMGKSDNIYKIAKAVF